MNRFARPIATLLLLLACLWAGYDMAQRYAKELLWGYRPLVLFVGLWLLAHALFTGRKPEGWQKWGLSALSGLLLGLGFPGYVPFPFLLFVGFVPLLWLEEQIGASELPHKGRQVFVHSYHAFLVWNILSTWWVANTALAAGIVAIVLNSLFMAVVFTLYHLARRMMPRLATTALLAFWMAFEYLHLNWEISWPWLTLGNGFAQAPILVQWYEYTGVFGGSLWVLGGNFLALALWKAWRKRALRTRATLRLAAWIALPAFFSAYLYFSYQEEGSQTVRVALVQPNYEPHFEKFVISESKQIDRFLSLSASVVNDSTDYLVWPETSFGYVNTRAIEAYPAVERLRAFMAPFPRLKVIAGIDAYHLFLPGEPHTRAVRVSYSSGEPVYFEALNAAAQFTSESSEVQLYRKSKLVPGPEILPYREVFGFFKPIIEQVQGTVAGVGTQKERTAMRSSSGRMAPVICYESVFGEFFTGYIRQGKAQAAFIMTNDGWWDNTPGHKQHLWIGRLRAIETRRSIARAANTGITCFINQRGDILQPTRYNEPVAISGQVRLNDRMTTYVQWGDFIARIAVFTTLILLLNMVVKVLQGWVLGKNRA